MKLEAPASGRAASLRMVAPCEPHLVVGGGSGNDEVGQPDRAAGKGTLGRRSALDDPVAPPLFGHPHQKTGSSRMSGRLLDTGLPPILDNLRTGRAAAGSTDLG